MRLGNQGLDATIAAALAPSTTDTSDVRNVLATTAGFMPCFSMAMACRRRCSNSAEFPFGLIANSFEKRPRESI